MKTRILAALLALALLLPAALTACDPTPGGDDTGNSTGDNAGVTPGPNPGDPFDGFVLTASADGAYDISDNLFGIFLEDINHAVDGGLYAEEIMNRSFEYGERATKGGEQGWTADRVADVEWKVVDGSADSSWLNKNNPHYARITNTGSEPHGIYNRGYYSDLCVVKDQAYDFSIYARAVDGYNGKIYVSLETMSGGANVSATIDSITGEWTKYTLTLTPTATATSNMRLVVRIDAGTVDIDMVSFMTQDLYKGSKNGSYGLRRDLAEMLESLTPNFLRFPGGCIIEGYRLETAYDWKDSIGGGLEFDINGTKTIGDVATRPQCLNIWADHDGKQNDAYYMSYGIGFYEYFLLCEDLGCEPIPVLNCGYSCQGRPGVSGPQPGTPEFQRYIDDALDLVEFCMGGTDTEWGALRAAMGHPEKFDLTYIGIGNEQYGAEYNKRYAKFREAFNEAAKQNPDLYGNIKLIMANGLTSGSRDGWDVVASKGADIADSLDEHYYNLPTWFLLNEHRYDEEYYDRKGPTVFVGEYAAKFNTSNAAIAEAAYMTSLEKNGDIVELAAYAPLFAYDTHTQWAPNLIWYSNNQVWGSVNFYVQKIYANNQPDKIIPSTLDGSNYSGAGEIKGKFGLGTWQTSAVFDDVVVTDTHTGEVLFSEDFSSSKVSDFNVVAGNFNIKDGALYQNNTAYPSNADTGDVIYMGSSNLKNYTLTFKAKKLGGNEGFIIPFAVTSNKTFWHWNIGGWGNTIAALEYAHLDGEAVVKTGQIPGTIKPFKVETNHEYEIKIAIDHYNVKGYIDGELMFDYDVATERGLYSVIGEDDDDIIVKLVNTSTSSMPVRVDLSAISNYSGEVEVQYINFVSAPTFNTSENTLVSIKTKTINISKVFDYDMSRLSMAVIRIPKK